MIVAIDGPAASGKGTLAKRVADHLGYALLDTGLLYRAVAREVAARGIDPENEPAVAQVARELNLATVADDALRGPGYGEAASVVAKHPTVRSALLELQRTFARRKPGAVLDGRDIGTIVCPDADVKIFVTARAEVRAERRYKERLARGEPAVLETVLADIRRRDERDSSREAAPMRPAEDAFLLDTSILDIEAAFEKALAVISRKVGQHG